MVLRVAPRRAIRVSDFGLLSDFGPRISALTISCSTLMPPTNTSSPKRIFLVDDHPLVREWLTNLINQQPGLTVCGEAESAQQARQQILALRPDVAMPWEDAGPIRASPEEAKWGTPIPPFQGLRDLGPIHRALPWAVLSPPFRRAHNPSPALLRMRLGTRTSAHR